MFTINNLGYDLNLYQRLRAKATLNIVLGDQYIYVGITNSKATTDRTDKCFFEILSYETVKQPFASEDYWQQLKRLLEKLPLSPKKQHYCAISLPLLSSQHSFYTIEMPLMSDEEINYHLQTDALAFWRVFCPELNADEHKHCCAYAKIGENPLASTMSVIISVIPRSVIDAINALFSSTTITPLLITNSHFVMTRYLVANNRHTTSHHLLLLEGEHISLHSMFDQTHLLSSLTVTEQDKGLFKSSRETKVKNNHIDRAFERLLTQVNALVTEHQHKAGQRDDRAKIYVSAINTGKGFIADLTATAEHYPHPLKLLDKAISVHTKQMAENSSHIPVALCGLSVIECKLYHQHTKSINYITAIDEVKQSLRFDVINRALKALLKVASVMFIIHITTFLPSLLTSNHDSNAFKKVANTLDVAKKQQQKLLAMFKLKEHKIVQLASRDKIERIYSTFINQLHTLVPQGMALESIDYRSETGRVQMVFLTLSDTLLNTLLLALDAKPYVQSVALGALTRDDSGIARTKIEVLLTPNSNDIP